jgi:AraC family transcriptional regulator
MELGHLIQGIGDFAYGIPRAYGHQLASAFHLDASQQSASVSSTSDVFAITRLTSPTGIADRTISVASEPAMLVSVALAPVTLGAYQAWVDGKAVETPFVPVGGLNLLDLQSDPTCWVSEGFDWIHHHLPRAILDDVARDHGFEAVGAYPVVIGGYDMVIAQLTRMIAPWVGGPESAGSLRLDDFALILAAHVLWTYGGLRRRAHPLRRGGLAPWQIRRAVEMLRAGLDGSIRLSALAAECSLSVSYFARAFKASLGVSPHRWLNEQRIELAKALLASGRDPLADIAVRTGFSDQAAFTRTFQKIVGDSPGRWRRAHSFPMNPAASS